MSMVPLDIIIVTYNAVKYEELCFHPLASLPDGWRVIAVDNGSSDGTAAMLRGKYPDFTVIENGKNLGFGPANNIGMRMALDRGAAAFLLNQDAGIDVDALLELMRIMAVHPECGIISPVHMQGNGKILDSGFAVYNSECFCPGFAADFQTGRLRELYYSTRGNAAAWLITPEALRRAGGFNPLFRHCGEDDDLRNRIFCRGLKLGVAGRVYARHAREGRKPASGFLAAYLADMLNPGQGSFFRFKAFAHALKRFDKEVFSALLFCWNNRVLIKRCRRMSRADAPLFLEECPR